MRNACKSFNWNGPVSHCHCLLTFSIVLHGLLPDDEPVQSAKETSFVLWLILPMTILVNTMKKHKRDRLMSQTPSRRPLLPRFSSLTWLMKLIPNRTRVLMVMQTLHHNQAGGTWPPSAFPLSVEILSGTRLVRTGTASHPLDSMNFLGLFLCYTHFSPHTFTHSVLAIA